MRDDVLGGMYIGQGNITSINDLIEKRLVPLPFFHAASAP